MKADFNLSSQDAPELTDGEFSAAMQDFRPLTEAMEVRQLDQYPPDELMCLLLAISQVSHDNKKTIGENNIQILDRWSQRLNAAMNTASISESGEC